jgi:hypothetical protein
MPDEKTGTMADIADAHIKQKGYVAVACTDGTKFIFSATTLRYLLKCAEENPAKCAIVFIPKDQVAGS